MKHERDISAPKWRLKKTLARRLEFRPIRDDDMKFIWAAYKKGALAPMAGGFASPDMEPEQFKAAFEAALLSHYHRDWLMFAEAKPGFVPVGMVLAFHQHPNHDISPFMIVGDIIWFPWASARNKIESAVNFFNTIRKEIAMVDYAHGSENRRFMEMLCRHGIMQRVGTTFNVVKGEATAIFETRSKVA